MDIRPKTSVGPSKPLENKHFGTDMPRGCPRKDFGLKNFGLIFCSLGLGEPHSNIAYSRPPQIDSAKLLLPMATEETGYQWEQQSHTVFPLYCCQGWETEGQTIQPIHHEVCLVLCGWPWNATISLVLPRRYESWRTFGMFHLSSVRIRGSREEGGGWVLLKSLGGGGFQGGGTRREDWSGEGVWGSVDLLGRKCPPRSSKIIL